MKARSLARLAYDLGPAWVLVHDQRLQMQVLQKHGRLCGRWWVHFTARAR